MKKQHVILCCGLALIVLAGAVYFGKREFDKNRAVKESVEASISEKRKDIEEDYIPHVYKDIHDAFPVDEGHSRYVTSEHLDEGCMYAYLCVYNEWAKKRDSNFKDLTLQEVREYLDSGEITVDYVTYSVKHQFCQSVCLGYYQGYEGFFICCFESQCSIQVIVSHKDISTKLADNSNNFPSKCTENRNYLFM